MVGNGSKKHLSRCQDVTRDKDVQLPFTRFYPKSNQFIFVGFLFKKKGSNQDASFSMLLTT